jgi:hypothetical protein
MEKVYVVNSEFDKSGNDWLTSLVGGFVALPLIFLGLVLLASCVA